MARALEIPMYQLFYDGEEPPADLPKLPKSNSRGGDLWGDSGKDERYLAKFRRLLGKMKPGDRDLILFMVQKTAWRSVPRPNLHKAA
jgi:hypothetical protein